MVEDIFDLRPGVLIKELKLRRPIFAKTASGGHFGREDPDFTWETPKIIDIKRWRDTRKVWYNIINIQQWILKDCKGDSESTSKLTMMMMALSLILMLFRLLINDQTRSSLIIIIDNHKRRYSIIMSNHNHKHLMLC